ncbi:MAG: exodeoxyribonuclease VII small subunit [Proteobacteria bacterium]|nr:exodeoxyribonuclease VII small subunit [Pseudomonadota bacterium]
MSIVEIEKRTPVQELSFEQALQELESIVKALENGNVELEAAMAYYTRGQQLKNHCDNKLQAAKLKVEQIITSPEGGALSTSEMGEL